MQKTQIQHTFQESSVCVPYHDTKLSSCNSRAPEVESTHCSQTSPIQAFQSLAFWCSGRSLFHTSPPCPTRRLLHIQLALHVSSRRNPNLSTERRGWRNDMSCSRVTSPETIPTGLRHQPIPQLNPAQCLRLEPCSGFFCFFQRLWNAEESRPLISRTCTTSNMKKYGTDIYFELVDAHLSDASLELAVVVFKFVSL